MERRRQYNEIEGGGGCFSLLQTGLIFVIVSRADDRTKDFVKRRGGGALILCSVRFTLSQAGAIATEIQN